MTTDHILLAEIVFGCQKMADQAKVRREKILNRLLEDNKKSELLHKEINTASPVRIAQRSIEGTMLTHESLDEMFDIASELIDFLEMIVDKDKSLRNEK